VYVIPPKLDEWNPTWAAPTHRPPLPILLTKEKHTRSRHTIESFPSFPQAGPRVMQQKICANFDIFFSHILTCYLSHNTMGIMQLTCPLYHQSLLNAEKSSIGIISKKTAKSTRTSTLQSTIDIIHTSFAYTCPPRSTTKPEPICHSCLVLSFFPSLAKLSKDRILRVIAGVIPYCK
jgi:hypothetical protein